MKRVRSAASLKRRFFSILLAVMMFSQLLPAAIMPSFAEGAAPAVAEPMVTESIKDQSVPFSPISDLIIQGQAAGDGPVDIELTAEAAGGPGPDTTDPSRVRYIEVVNQLSSGVLPAQIYLTISRGAWGIVYDHLPLTPGNNYAVSQLLGEALSAYTYKLDFRTTDGADNSLYEYSVVTSEEDKRVYLKVTNSAKVSRTVTLRFENGATPPAAADVQVTIAWGSGAVGPVALAASEGGTYTGEFPGFPEGVMDYSFGTNLDPNLYNIMAYTEPDGNFTYIVTPKAPKKADFLVVKEWIVPPGTTIPKVDYAVEFSGKSAGADARVDTQYIGGKTFPAGTKTFIEYIEYETERPVEIAGVTLQHYYGTTPTPTLYEFIDGNLVNPIAHGVKRLGTSEITDAAGKVIGLKVYNTVVSDVKITKEWDGTGMYAYDTAGKIPSELDITLKYGGKYAKTAKIPRTGDLPFYGSVWIQDVPMGDLSGPFDNQGLFDVDESHLDGVTKTVVKTFSVDGRLTAVTLVNKVETSGEGLDIHILKRWVGAEPGELVRATFVIECVNDPTFRPESQRLELQRADSQSANSVFATFKLEDPKPYIQNDKTKGRRIFTVSESVVPSGYSLAEFNQLTDKWGEGLWEFTNEKSARRITVTKNWADVPPDFDMNRPAVTVYVKRNAPDKPGNPMEYLMQDGMGGYTTTPDKAEVGVLKGTVTSYANGEKILDHSFPRRAPDGSLYAYSIEEEMAADSGYYTVILPDGDGFVVTNRYTGGNINDWWWGGAKGHYKWWKNTGMFFYDGSMFPEVKIRLWASNSDSFSEGGSVLVGEITVPPSYTNLVRFYFPTSLAEKLAPSDPVYGVYTYFYLQEVNNSAGTNQPWLPDNAAGGLRGPYTRQALQSAASGGLSFINELDGKWGDPGDAVVRLQISQNWVFQQQFSGKTMDDYYASYRILLHGEAIQPPASAFQPEDGAMIDYSPSSGVLKVYGRGIVTINLPEFDPDTFEPLAYTIEAYRIMDFPPDMLSCGFRSDLIRIGNNYRFTNIQDIRRITAKKEWDMSRYDELSAPNYTLNDATLDNVWLDVFFLRRIAGSGSSMAQFDAQSCNGFWWLVGPARYGYTYAAVAHPAFGWEGGAWVKFEFYVNELVDVKNNDPRAPRANFFMQGLTPVDENDIDADGGIDVRLVNSYTDDVIFSVQKRWQNLPPSLSEGDFSITIQLEMLDGASYRQVLPGDLVNGAGFVNPVTLSPGQLTHAFTKLPKATGSGGAIVYRVREVAINGVPVDEVLNEAKVTIPGKGEFIIRESTTSGDYNAIINNRVVMENPGESFNLIARKYWDIPKQATNQTNESYRSYILDLTKNSPVIFELYGIAVNPYPPYDRKDILLATSARFGTPLVVSAGDPAAFNLDLTNWALGSLRTLFENVPMYVYVKPGTQNTGDWAPTLDRANGEPLRGPDGRLVRYEYAIRENMANMQSFIPYVAQLIIMNDDLETGAATAALGNTYADRRQRVTVTKEITNADQSELLGALSVSVNFMTGSGTYPLMLARTGNGWTGSLELPSRNAAGNPITYTVTEEISIAGNPGDYRLVEYRIGSGAGWTAAEGNSFQLTLGDADIELTLRNEIETEMDLIVEKVWEDDNNTFGLRPTNFTLRLRADLLGGTGYPLNVTLSGDDVTAERKDYTIRVPQYAVTGAGATAVVTRLTPSHYRASEDAFNNKAYLNWNGVNQTPYDSGAGKFTITNALDRVSVVINKTWNDLSNEFATRPESLAVDLVPTNHMLPAGSLPPRVTDTRAWSKSGNTWSLTVAGLPRNLPDGTAILYKATETIPQGYTSNVTVGGILYADNDTTSSANYTLNLGNKLNTRPLGKLEKVWVGVEPGFEALQPDPLRVRLMRKVGDSGTPEVVKRNNAPYEFTLSRESTPPWTLNLNNVEVPLEDASGNPYVYFIQEIDSLQAYTVAADSVENGGALDLKLTNTLKRDGQIEVIKTWDDQYGPGYSNQRPQYSLQVTLEGKLSNTGTPITRTASMNNNGTDTWSCTFMDLPVADSAGAPIQYTVRENLGGYKMTFVPPEAEWITLTQSNQYKGQIRIQNTIELADDIGGRKIWADDNDDYKTRPPSITIALWRRSANIPNGEIVYDNVVVGPPWLGTPWAWSFSGLQEKDAYGAAYTYYVQEKFSQNLIAYSVSSDVNSPMDITNTLKKTNLQITKAWMDDYPEFRPTSINVTVTGKPQGGAVTVYEQVHTLTPGGSGVWAATIQVPLYTYYNGAYVLIDYTVSDNLKGYKPASVQAPGNAQGNYAVTLPNTLEPIALTITKEWEGENQGEPSNRPASITVTLTADNTGFSRDVVLTPANNWTVTFTDLQQYYADGINPVVYRVSEPAVNGYTPNHTAANLSVVASDGNKPFALTLKNKLISIGIEVEKVWNDYDRPSPVHPSAIDITLLANGSPYRTYTLKASEGWRHTFQNLPERDSVTNLPIQYSVAETPVGGYTPSYSPQQVSGAGGKITITNTLDALSLEFTKDWDDRGKESLRPDHLVVTLTGTGMTGNVSETYYSKTATLTKIDQISKGNDQRRFWSLVFENIPRRDLNGELITYTVQEVVPQNYEITWEDPPVISGNATTYFASVTNSVASGSVTITKTWEDMNNQYGTRPLSIKVRLMRMGAGGQADMPVSDWVDINAGGAPGKVWSYTFTGILLDDGSGGNHAFYVEEQAVPGYVMAYPGGVKGNAITNTLEKKTLQVTKEWVVYGHVNQIPAGITLEVERSTDGITWTAYPQAAAGQFTTLANPVRWVWTFDDLPAKGVDNQGNAVSYWYRARELDDLPNFTKSGIAVTGAGLESHFYQTYLINTLKVKHIKVTKVWLGEADNGASRPGSLWVTLRANMTNIPDARVNLAAQTPKWEYTFSNLPMLDSEGRGITYTVVEDVPVPGYDATKMADSVTMAENYTDPAYALTLENTQKKTSVTVTKVWDDGNNPQRPDKDSVTIVLYRSGDGSAEELVTGVTPHVTVSPDGNMWTYVFANLPMVSPLNGQPYRYRPDEVGVPEGYHKRILDYTITNRLQTGAICGSKTWLDQADLYGTRPGSIEVALERSTNGINWYPVPDKAKPGSFLTKEVTGPYWFWSFGGVDTDYNSSGGKYQFRVVETAQSKLANYTAMHDPSNGMNLINELKVKQIKGKKLWGDGYEWARPDSVKATLWRNLGGAWGEVRIGSMPVTREATAGNNWTWDFGELPAMDAQGRNILYEIRESTPNGWTATPSATGYDITNTIKTASLKVTKEWQPAADETGERPDSILVSITSSDPNDPNDRTITLAKPNWSDSISGLPVYTKEGALITYTATEITPLNGYMPTVRSGSATLNVSNPAITLVNAQKLTSVTVYKVWDDGNSLYRPQPEDIQIVLKRTGDGKETIVSRPVTPSISPDGSVWVYVFDNLPAQSQSGQPYAYTPDESELPKGYLKTVVGNTITNKLLTNAISGGKTWADQANLYKTRPASIEVKLQRSLNGVDWYDVPDKADTGWNSVLKQTVTGPNWTWSFDNVDTHEYASGAPYQFSVVETSGLKNYTSAQNPNNRMNLVNTLKTMPIWGRKEWPSGTEWLRPGSVTVTLQWDISAENVYEDVIIGSMPVTREVTAPDWGWDFGNLPETDAGGRTLHYRVVEKPHRGWSASPGTCAYTIANSLKKIDITITKQWENDAGNTERRPAGLTVTLRALNLPFFTAIPITLTPANNWSWSSQAAQVTLPKYNQNGELVIYEVSEPTVHGYTAIQGKELIVPTDAGMEYSLMLINRLKLTSITVTKVWDDEGNPDRPKSLEIVLRRSDGVAVAPSSVAQDPQNSGVWVYEFKDLPLEDINGAPYTYRGEEAAENVPGGYVRTYEGKDNTTIQNKLLKDSVTGYKTWVNDHDNQLDTRPLSVTVKLMRSRDNGVTWEDVPNKANPGPNSALTQTVTGPSWMWVFKGVDTHYTDDAGMLRPYLFCVEELNTPVNYTAGYLNAIVGMNLVNTLKTTQIQGKKTWDPADDGYYWIRPDKITVTLQRQASTGWLDVMINKLPMTRTATALGGWSWNFENLPAMDKNGNAILYRVQEEHLQAWTSAPSSGYDITNTLKKATLLVKKSWQGEMNEDHRPEGGIDVIVKSSDPNDPTVRAGTLRAPDWALEFPGLPLYTKTGALITYTAEETSPAPGYTATKQWGSATLDGANPTIFLTNTLKKMTVVVTKVWDDGGNPGRPGDLEITLRRNDGATVKSSAFEENGNIWTYTFTNLPAEDKNGEPYTYKADEETVPKGYVKLPEGDATIRNKLQTDVVTGYKEWDDQHNRYGTRPASIEVKLRRSVDGLNWSDVPDKLNPGPGSALWQTVSGPNWTWIFYNVDTHDNVTGQAYQFRVEEASVPKNYTYKQDPNNGMNLINSLKKRSLAGYKVWPSGTEWLRPDRVTVTLQWMVNGSWQTVMVGPAPVTRTATAANGWRWDFEDMPDVDADGNPISYRVVETPHAGWAAQPDACYNIWNTVNALTNIKVTKVWENDADNLWQRPGSLLVNLSALNLPGFSPIPITLTPSNAWSWNSENTQVVLPKYNQLGDLVIYQVTEQAVSGYTALQGRDVIVPTKEEMRYGLTLVNRLKTTSITVTKVWDDENNPARPENLTVILRRSDGEAIQPSALTKNGHIWSYVFSDLPTEDISGNPYTYEGEEPVVPDGYHRTYEGKDGTTIRNKLLKDAVAGYKTWVNDSGNQFDTRPSSITVKLMRSKDGGATWENVPDKANPEPNSPLTQTVTGPSWSWLFRGVDTHYTENGGLKPYAFCVEELTKPANYTAGYPFGAAEMHLVNTLKTTQIQGHKGWDPAAGFEWVRPDKVTVTLQRKVGNGWENVTAGGMPMTRTATAANGWAWSFTNLPAVDKNGVTVEYRVQEEHMPAWVSTPSSGYNITNTLRKATLTVKKSWLGEIDEEHRPANGIGIIVRSSDPGAPAQLAGTLKAPSWEVTFQDLPLYTKTGTLITYTAEETSPVPGYTATKQWGFVTLDGVNPTITLANTFKKTAVTVTKVWDDGNNTARPQNLEVILRRNDGVTFTPGQPIPIKNGNIWTYAFTNLPAEDVNGEPYTYRAEEPAVPDGYVRFYEGETTIWNKLQAGFVSGYKTWDDQNNRYGTQPASIEVKLQRSADGLQWHDVLEKVSGLVMTRTATAPNWSWTFEEVDTDYDNAGGKYTFRVVELTQLENYFPPTYTGGKDGMNITNTLRTTDVEGKKVWNPAQGFEWVRPNRITVRLQQKAGNAWQDVTLGSMPLTRVATESNGWAWSFKDLPRLDAKGVPIEYRVVEETLPAWAWQNVGNYDIENTVVRTSLFVEKVWHDQMDGGHRPEAGIEIQITSSDRNDRTERKVTLEAPDWVVEVKDLPVYSREGALITYTATEVNPPRGFTATVRTGSITLDQDERMVTLENTLKTTSETVYKVWDDGNSPGRPAPDGLVIQLIRNDGVVVTSNQPAVDGNVWKYVFDNLLAESANGMPYTYTVNEETVPAGYQKAIAGKTITNKLLVDAIGGGKTWDDQNNLFNTRPLAIVVKLQRSGDGGATWHDVPNKASPNLPLTQTATAPNWTWTFAGVDTDFNSAGGKYMFRVVELTQLANYLPAAYTGGINGMNLTNTLKTTKAAGSKGWDPVAGYEWVRPNKITVRLQRKAGAGEVWNDVTVASMPMIREVTAQNGWAWSFEGLPEVDSTGEPVQYRVVEEALPGWDAEPVWQYSIKNSVKKATLTVEKKWLGEMDDTQRPALGIDVIVTSSDLNDTTTRTGTLMAPYWKLEFPGLPQYTNMGSPITYTAYETTQAPGYTATKSWGSAALSENTVIALENTQKTAPVTVMKAWDHKGNPDKPGDNSLTVVLTRSDGQTFESSAPTTKDGDTWYYVFANMLVEDAKGTPFTYSADEMTVPNGYAKTVDRLKITNTFVVGEIKGFKEWEDSNNRFGTRPAFYTVYLERSADGSNWECATNPAGAIIPAQVLNAGTGTFGFDNVAKSTPEGGEYTFRVREENVDPRYHAEVDDTTNTITNRLRQTEIPVAGKKTWVPDDNWLKPDYIVLTLQKSTDAPQYAAWTDVQIFGWTVRAIVGAGEGWAYDFGKLPAVEIVNRAGVDIRYRVRETPLAGWTPVYADLNSEGPYDITNVQKSGELTVEIAWEGDQGFTDQRPDEVEVTLTSSETPDPYQQTANVPPDADTAKNWSHTFTNLPLFDKNGSRMRYTAAEKLPIHGYVARIPSASSTLPDTGTATVTLVNVLQTIEISLEKIWVDYGRNEENTRPDTVTVVFKASNGAPNRQYTLRATENWAFTSQLLPMFDNITGERIVYTVEELPVAGYTADIRPATFSSDCFITAINTLETVDLSGEKVWNDQNNAFNTRPATIQIQLQRTVTPPTGYVNYGSVQTVSGAQMKWSFTQLPKRDRNGNLYEYRVTEIDTDGAYRVSQPAAHGLMNLTNTLEMIKLTVIADWIDDNNAHGTRPQPEILQVTVTGDGKTYTFLVSNVGGTWTYSRDLPKYDTSGAPITYTITQQVPGGYRQYSITQPSLNASGTELVGRVENELITTTVRVVKQWAGTPPSRPAIQFRVMNGATTVRSDTIQPGETQKVYTGLLKFHPRSTTPIQYTVIEEPVANFTATYARAVDEATNTTTLMIVNTYTQSPTATPPGPTATPPGPTATPTGPTATPPGPTATPPGPTATPPRPTATPPRPTATPPRPTATPPRSTATPQGPGPTVTPTQSPGIIEPTPPRKEIEIDGIGTINVIDPPVPLGAGSNLNEGDCFD